MFEVSMYNTQTSTEKKWGKGETHAQTNLQLKSKSQNHIISEALQNDASVF